MNSKVYSEVFSILKALGNKYIDAIPKDVFETIKNNIDSSYQPEYTIDNINKVKIYSDALALIAYFNSQFWHKYSDDNDIIYVLNENQ